MQERAGVADRADGAAAACFKTEVPAGGGRVPRRRSRGSCSAPPTRDDRMWASVLYGGPGLRHGADAATVHIAARPLAGDPLEGALDGPVGGLALEPGTRRRMRLNGAGAADRRTGRRSRSSRSTRTARSTSRRATSVASTPARPSATPARLSTRARGRAARARGHRVRRHPRARTRRRRLPPRRQPGLPARGRRAHDRLARLHGQLDVQHARQHRGRPGLRPDRRRPADGTTLYLSGRAEIVWEDGGFPSAQRARLAHGRGRRAPGRRRTAALGARAPGPQPAGRSHALTSAGPGSTRSPPPLVRVARTIVRPET